MPFLYSMKIKEIHNQIKLLAKSEEYKHEQYFGSLMHHFEQFEFEDWENLSKQIVDWATADREVLVDIIIEIKENKKSYYDTGKLYAEIFIQSDSQEAQGMIENFEFIDNGIPKEIILIDQLMEKLKLIEPDSSDFGDFVSFYQMIYKLYNEAVC